MSKNEKNGKMTAYEQYKKIESEIKLQSNLAESNSSLAKCTIHLTNYSKNCRQCKRIKETQTEEPTYQEKSVNMDKYYYDAGDRGDNLIPIRGESAISNLNSMLRQNIQTSVYYKELIQLRDINQLINEVERSVTNAETWAPGGQGVPSSMFCCLYRLMTMHLNASSLRQLLDYESNVLVRCMGFLYVRYAVDPNFLWAWVKKYVTDEQEVRPSLDQTVVMSIGQYVEQLVTDLNYYNTRLPRIPQQIETLIQANIVMQKEKQQRSKINQRLSELFVKGAQIRAISKLDDEWHVGLIVSAFDNWLDIEFKEGRVERIDFGDIEYIPRNEAETQYIAEMIARGMTDGPMDIPLEVVIPPVSDVRKNSENKGGSSSESKSSKSSRSSSSGKRSPSEKKKKNKKKKKHQKHRRSRSRSRKHKQSQKKQKKGKKKGKDKDKEKDKEKEKEKFENSIEAADQQMAQKYESNKERQERLQKEIKQKIMDKAVACSRQEVAKVPASFKTSISTAFPTSSKHSRRSPSPQKKKEQFVELQQPDKEKVKDTQAKIQEVNPYFQELSKKYGTSVETKKNPINLDSSDKINNDYA